MLNCLSSSEGIGIEGSPFTFGLDPIVLRGNTCFLCQITHHLHLMTLIFQSLQHGRHMQSHNNTFLCGSRIDHLYSYESFTHIFSVYVDLSLEAVSIISDVTSMQCTAECLSHFINTVAHHRFEKKKRHG